MATMRVAVPAVATMKVAQITKPGAGFQIVEREVPEPDAGHVRIKVQPVVFATAMCSRWKACGQDFSIRGFRGMKWQASSMKWVRVFPRGRRDSG